MKGLFIFFFQVSQVGEFATEFRGHVNFFFFFFFTPQVSEVFF